MTQRTITVPAPPKPHRTDARDLGALIAKWDEKANHAADMYEYVAGVVEARVQAGSRWQYADEANRDLIMRKAKDESLHLKDWGGAYDFAQKQIVRYTAQLQAYLALHPESRAELGGSYAPRQRTH